jgi:hypothetical protein
MTSVPRSKEMPLEVAEHLGRIVKPLVDEIGSTVAAGKRWGISQSHVSQIQNGAGCGIAVLLTLREKLGLSLEELCFPPAKRKADKPAPPAAPLDELRALLREEIANAARSTPTEPPTPIHPSKGHHDAPRPRRR